MDEIELTGTGTHTDTGRQGDSCDEREKLNRN